MYAADPAAPACDATALLSAAADRPGPGDGVGAGPAHRPRPAAGLRPGPDAGGAARAHRGGRPRLPGRDLRAHPGGAGGGYGGVRQQLRPAHRQVLLRQPLTPGQSSDPAVTPVVPAGTDRDPHLPPPGHRRAGEPSGQARHHRLGPHPDPHRHRRRHRRRQRPDRRAPEPRHTRHARAPATADRDVQLRRVDHALRRAAPDDPTGRSSPSPSGPRKHPPARRRLPRPDGIVLQPGRLAPGVLDFVGNDGESVYLMPDGQVVDGLGRPTTLTRTASIIRNYDGTVTYVYEPMPGLVTLKWWARTVGPDGPSKAAGSSTAPSSTGRAGTSTTTAPSAPGPHSPAAEGSSRTGPTCPRRRQGHRAPPTRRHGRTTRSSRRTAGRRTAPGDHRGPAHRPALRASLAAERRRRRTERRHRRDRREAGGTDSGGTTDGSTEEGSGT